jgi:hypothetical protein
LVWNRVRFKKEPAKKYISLQGGGETQKCTIFLCDKLSFILFWPSRSFFLQHLHCCSLYFHCSYLYNYYYIYLEHCALNAKFQHFIPRFNKTSLLCWPHSKRG